MVDNLREFPSGKRPNISNGMTRRELLGVALGVVGGAVAVGVAHEVAKNSSNAIKSTEANPVPGETFEEILNDAQDIKERFERASIKPTEASLVLIDSPLNPNVLKPNSMFLAIKGSLVSSKIITEANYTKPVGGIEKFFKIAVLSDEGTVIFTSYRSRNRTTELQGKSVIEFEERTSPKSRSQLIKGGYSVYVLSREEESNKFGLAIADTLKPEAIYHVSTTPVV